MTAATEGNNMTKMSNPVPCAPALCDFPVHLRGDPVQQCLRCGFIVVLSSALEEHYGDNGPNEGRPLRGFIRFLRASQRALGKGSGGHNY